MNHNWITLLQINGLGLKTLEYENDLVSGEVNSLAYQHGYPDG